MVTIDYVLIGVAVAFAILDVIMYVIHYQPKSVDDTSATTVEPSTDGSSTDTYNDSQNSMENSTQQ